VVVIVVAEELEEDEGRARERWTERSEEPVRRYVPGGLEKVIALTGPAGWIDYQR
jgi:hypothetical protein